MPSQSANDDAPRTSDSETQAVLTAMLQRVPPPVRHAADWVLHRWIGRVGLRTSTTLIGIDVFDRSMTIAAQFFSSMLPILILFATWVQHGNTQGVAQATSMPAETQALLQETVQDANGPTFGLFGTALVILTATSLSRALTRAFSAIWQRPRPRTQLSSVWRWVAAVAVFATSVAVVHILSAGAEHLEQPGIWQAAFNLAFGIAISLVVPWVLLSGTVGPRLLAPGALLFGLSMLVVRPLAIAWFPRAVQSSADHYGSIGVAFTYLGLLYALSLLFLLTATIGQVIATDSGRVGTWIQARAQARGPAGATDNRNHPDE